MQRSFDEVVAALKAGTGILFRAALRLFTLRATASTNGSFDEALAALKVITGGLALAVRAIHAKVNRHLVSGKYHDNCVEI